MADAHIGAGRYGARPQHQPPAPAVQGLSVPVARRSGHETEPGVDYRYHLHPAGTLILLLCSRDRLVQQEGVELENQQCAGHDILRGLFAEGVTALCQPRDIQQRSGLPVQQRSFHWRAKGARYCDQHGRTRPGVRQHHRRAAMAPGSNTNTFT